MQLYTTIFAAALAATASAVSSSTASTGIVHWISQDENDRSVTCTPQVGQPSISNFDIAAGATYNQSFPEGWIGNCYATISGKPDIPGMLAEFRWNGWEGINFYDVSAIVNADDTENIQTLFPLGAQEPMSGCSDGSWPCDTVYLHPDDVQTQSTKENELVCTLGVSNSAKRTKRQGPVRRSYVLGELNEM